MNALARRLADAALTAAFPAAATPGPAEPPLGPSRPGPRRRRRLSLRAALLATWAVFGAGFVARPLGAAFFARYGDRIGRNRMLALSVLCMSGATFLIGLLPGYATIGLAAPLLLLVLRALQGFSTGGEYTGASAFIMEYAPADRRASTPASSR